VDQASVSISSVRAIYRYLEKHQCDAAQLWQSTPLDEHCLDNPDYRIPLTDYQVLWNNAIAITNDSAFGLHLGENSDASEMGLVANVLIHEETFRDSLLQYVRLYSLVNDGFTLRFEEGNEKAQLYFHHLSPSFYHVSDMERTLVISLIRAQQFIHKDIRMSRVGFAHPKPDYGDEYMRIFGCAVEFDQADSFIEIPTEYLDYAPVRKNPYTRSALLSYSDSALNKINKGRFSTEVKDHIIDLLQHKKADVDEVAKRMHMSRHTLYRRLKSENITFQDLVEETRKENAIELVSSDHTSLSEVAFLLGFSELSSFSRAFKRWTGVSPKQYRENPQPIASEAP
jgi:AraC-like DNA-binding protein